VASSAAAKTAYIKSLAKSLGISESDVAVALAALNCPRRLEENMFAPVRRLAVGDVEADYTVTAADSTVAASVATKLQASTLKTSLQSNLVSEIQQVQGMSAYAPTVASVAAPVVTGGPQPTPAPAPNQNQVGKAFSSQPASAVLLVMWSRLLWCLS